MMRFFDRRMGIILLTLIFLLAILSFIDLQMQKNQKIQTQIFVDEVIGEMGPVTIQFQNDVDHQEIENSFRLTPEREGSFVWKARTLYFYPLRGLDGGTTIHLSLGLTDDNKPVSEVVSGIWDIQVRKPGIVYTLLNEQQDGGTVWVNDPEQNMRKSLVDLDSGLDYSIAVDGSWLVFSRQNQTGGRDLWSLDLQSGGGENQLLACEMDECTQPVIQPQGNQQIAYVRKKNGHSSVWLYQPDDNSDGPVLEQAGVDPVWSPDGKMLAFRSDSSLSIVSLESGELLSIPILTFATGNFSPDSTQFIYVSEDDTGLGTSSVWLVNLKDQSVELWSGEDNLPTMYSVPVWDPDGDKILIGSHLVGGVPTKQLELVSVDHQEHETITNDPLYYHASAQWEPDGRRLVFQRIQSPSGGALPEIVLWDREKKEAYILAQGAIFPRWLP